MLYTAKKFYYLYGIRRISDIVIKDLIPFTEFGFPKDSIYHYLDTKHPEYQYPDSSNFFLQYSVKLPLKNSKFIEPPKSFRVIPSKLNKLIASIRTNTNYKVLTKDTVDITSPRIPLIMNHQALYQIAIPITSRKIYNWDKWVDIYTNMFLNINSNYFPERSGYIIFEVDDVIPTISTLRNKLINESSPMVIDKFSVNDTGRLLMSLWRWAYEDDNSVKQDSVFSVLNKAALTNTNLVLKNNKSFILLNLATLKNWLSDTKTRKTVLLKLLALFIRVSEGIDTSKIETSNDGEDNDYDNTDVAETEITKKLINHNLKSEIDNKVLEKGSKVSRNVKKEVYDEINTKDLVVKQISSLKETGMLKTTNAKQLLSILEKQPSTKSPFNKDLTLEKDMKVTKKDIVVSDKEVTVPVKDALVDKTMSTNVVGTLDKKYSRIMHKDILNSLYSIQSTGVLIKDFKVINESSITGDSQTYEISLKPVYGKASKIKLKMPVVNEEGEFTISGSTYRMRKLRTDVPIRKISGDRVSLTTYYGKLFVDRAIYKRMDTGYWIASYVLKNSGTDGSDIKSALSSISVDNVRGLPSKYTSIGRYLRSFMIKDYFFNFNYETRNDILPSDVPLSSVEIKNTVLVGKNSEGPIVMNKTGNLFTVDGSKLNPHTSLEEIIGLDPNKDPGSPIMMKIMGVNIPIALILSYFITIEGLFDLLNVKYDIYRLRDKVEDLENKAVIKFADSKLVFTKTHDYRYNILVSLLYVKEFKSINFDDLSNKDTYVSILHAGIVRKLNILDTNFVDPISRDLLKSMNEPTTFRGLLVRSAELLETDYHPKPQDIDYMTIKGYERFAGLMYKQLMNSIEDFNRRNLFGNSSINIDPYIMYSTLNTDSSVTIVEDLNPIGSLKQQEDVTYIGTGGRAKETMVKKTRFMDVNDLGVISELSKDSADVGISAYLSASPNIRNLRGLKSHNVNIDVDGGASVFSTSAMLAPGSENDD